MLYPDVPEVDIVEFNGAQPRLEPYTIPPSNAIYAQNMAYLRGQTSTRLGHSSVVVLNDGAITTLANWFFVISGAQVSVVAYYAPSVGARLLNQTAGFTLQTVQATTGAAGAVFVTAAERLYMAFYDSTGRIGFAGGKVYGWSVGTDPLFAAPIQNAITPSETGAGVCTAGMHRIGYLTTTRNGYTGMLQPVDANTKFAPASFTSSGLKNIQVQINGAIPSYLTGGTIQVVMTTVANPNQWFTVPGATSLPLNPTTITVSISDDDLAATGTDVTTRVTLITQNVAGADPFKPYAIWSYSSRMCYAYFDAFGFPQVAISEPNDFQFITQDQHVITLEGQRQCVMGFSLRGVNYMGATDGFYSNEDNGDVPVTWTPAQRVDGSIGILSATCVYVNPSAGYALVASERGFYLFQGGVFPPLPLSFYQDSDWSRINWAIPTQVQIAEDTRTKEFIVLAPLTCTVQSVSGTGPYTVTTNLNPHLYQIGQVLQIIGVTGNITITSTGLNTFVIPGGQGAPTVGGTIFPQQATHQLKWNYEDGSNADTVKYSLDAFDSSSVFTPSSIGVIRTLGTLLPEVYYGPSANGSLLRKNSGGESSPYTDNPSGIIRWVYETALMPFPLQPGVTLRDYHGAHFEWRGIGSVGLIVNGLNGIHSVVPALSPVALAVSPSSEQLVRWALRAERQSIRMWSNTINTAMTLSLIRVYYTDSTPQR